MVSEPKERIRNEYRNFVEKLKIEYGLEEGRGILKQYQ
jgi:hypothetical protein